ncbi:hypothetical protein K8R47_00275 [archaeon]|nr:hypothetical protein [archaeon]
MVKIFYDKFGSGHKGGYTFTSSPSLPDLDIVLMKCSNEGYIPVALTGDPLKINIPKKACAVVRQGRYLVYNPDGNNHNVQVESLDVLRGLEETNELLESVVIPAGGLVHLIARLDIKSHDGFDVYLNAAQNVINPQIKSILEKRENLSRKRGNILERNLASMW